MTLISSDLPPIPPATLRVSVVWPDGSRSPCTVDLPTGAIVCTLRDLEDHVGAALSVLRTRRAAYAAMSAAAKAADDGNVRIVTAAGLWLYLHHPDAGHATAGQRLADALAHGGSALLLAMVGHAGGGWTYRLHAMPRWPVAVTPTEPDVQRRSDP